MIFEKLGNFSAHTQSIVFIFYRPLSCDIVPQKRCQEIIIIRFANHEVGARL
jgi:hypothetical protein